MKKIMCIFYCFIFLFLIYGSAIAQQEKALPGIITILLDETVPPEPFYSFPDTGLTKCYDNTEEIACPPAGSDFYGQDAQFPRHPRSYTKLGEGGTELDSGADGGDWIMTRDNVTGLIWEVKTIDNKNLTYTWQDAHDFISTLNTAEFGGYNDWRMPTRLELAFLINRGSVRPAIEIDWFPNINTENYQYWSSSPRAKDENYAWRVHFTDGFVSYVLKSELLSVRAVRSE